MGEKPFYKPIYDITADAGVEVWGGSEKELLCNAILAAAGEIADIEKAQPEEEIILEVDSAGFPFILADAVNKFLYTFDVKKFIPRRCEVLELKPDGSFAKLKLLGERYNPEKHGRKLLIKAATYHGLEVKRENNRLRARIIFDI
jgi:SHS2 domain-containing protein